MSVATPKRKSAAARRRLPSLGTARRWAPRIESLRERVAAAAAIWKEAKEQAAQAKRRRKLAKLIARRAKQDAKTAKANLEEARQALAQAEARAITRGTSSAARRKVTKVKSGKAPSRKRSSVRRRIRKTPRKASAPPSAAPSPAPMAPTAFEQPSANNIESGNSEAGKAGETPTTF